MDGGKIIVEQLQDIVETMCDDYCRYPREDYKEEYITEICENCPLNKLI